MERMDYWRLCDELTVVQAALLIVGCLPEECANVEAWSPDQQPHGYPAVRAALTSAILSQALDASIRRRAWVVGWTEAHDPIGFDDDDPKITFGQLSHVVFERGSADILGSPAWPMGGAKPPKVAFRAEPDWNLSTLKVTDLRKWLQWRGVNSGFFFPAAAGQPDFIDPRHVRYAPKLAAAVRAWQAVQDPNGKHPKQALTKWLREHAAEFGLSDDEGKPNEQGIEECAKVANWQPGGGAPKTPGA